MYKTKLVITEKKPDLLLEDHVYGSSFERNSSYILEFRKNNRIVQFYFSYYTSTW